MGYARTGRAHTAAPRTHREANAETRAAPTFPGLRTLRTIRTPICVRTRSFTGPYILYIYKI